MQTRRFTLLPSITLAVMLTMLVGQSLVFGDDDGKAQAGRIEGVWRVNEVILTDCSPTGVPARTVADMNMFIHGGQLIETPGTLGVGDPTRQRVSPGLGTWQHLGKGHYSVVFRFFRFNRADDTFAGTQIVYKAIELSKDGGTFTSTGTTDIFDADDHFITTRCTKGTATRLE